MYHHMKFLPAGDQAVSVELGDAISPEINRKVHQLYSGIKNQSISGIIDLVPTYRAILIYYDSMRLPLAELERQLIDLEQHLMEADLVAAKVIEIPTIYGGDFGPDLPYIMEYTGLSLEEVVRVHSSTDYLVYSMGFTPGFPYLGGMSEKIATPRLQTPRTIIPAGSVGIAEQQTGIYPIESPGGWRLIGRTPVTLFDPRRNPPVVVEPGDYIRFVSITHAVYCDIEKQIQNQSYEFIVSSLE